MKPVLIDSDILIEVSLAGGAHGPVQIATIFPATRRLFWPSELAGPRVQPDEVQLVL